MADDNKTSQGEKSGLVTVSFDPNGDSLEALLHEGQAFLSPVEESIIRALLTQCVIPPKALAAQTTVEEWRVWETAKRAQERDELIRESLAELTDQLETDLAIFDEDSDEAIEEEVKTDCICSNIDYDGDDNDFGDDHDDDFDLDDDDNAYSEIVETAMVDKALGVKSIYTELLFGDDGSDDD